MLLIQSVCQCLPTLLAPQSGDLSRLAFRDFRPIHPSHPLIVGFSLQNHSMVIWIRPRQNPWWIKVDENGWKLTKLITMDESGWKWIKLIKRMKVNGNICSATSLMPFFMWPWIPSEHFSDVTLANDSPNSPFSPDSPVSLDSLESYDWPDSFVSPDLSVLHYSPCL